MDTLDKTTSLSEDTDDIESLLSRSYGLRRQIRKYTKELADTNRIICEKAVFKDGSNTGVLSSQNFVAKVIRKFSVKWDQEVLCALRSRWGIEKFSAVFKTEFRPEGAKALKSLTLQETSELESAKDEHETSPYVDVEFTGEIAL
ncbi:MAG: hypothetical protein LBH05_01650 [Deferribacteraceae bacterium]|jgi:hypothetical protein|nr:hypothetical protein [Deferribacteraceae bacterium]